jgi:NAD(P)H-hydrate epimerase
MSILSSTASLLTNEQMARADAMAVAAGVSNERLMEAAGTAVAREIARRLSKAPVVVLCGPGNNGGDGFVAARKLKEAGWPVRVALLGERTAMKGEAGLNAKRWDGPVDALSEGVLEGAGIVVDALFGSGLARPLEGAPRAVIEAVAAKGLASVAVDVPSGVHGDTGQVLGAAAPARLTVTFYRAKPGHYLMPGRELCGETVVADIGTPPDALDAIQPSVHVNTPALWLARFPWPKMSGHKYSRGHGIVVGGAKMTGAARLAARAALRAGAGLVTIAAPPEAIPIYASYMPGVLTAATATDAEFAALLADPRKKAVLVGPGNGVGEGTRARVRAVLAAKRACVLDADALTSFAEDPNALLGAAKGPCILTPHDGEFARLFGGAIDPNADKLSRARAAAKLVRAVVLIKGADTVIAAPDGRAVINANAPPELATAGAGDVLSGLALGLLTQGTDAFDAACASAWLQGSAAAEFGPGLIAEDLEAMIPAALRRLRTAAGLT